jgi:hypothetical protein
MKLFLLSLFVSLAVTITVRAEASTPSDRKLLKAIQDDDPKPVDAYIHFRRDPNAVIEPSRDMVTGETLLHHAASYGSMKVVELLLKSGADPLQMDASMKYPIEEAIRNDKKDIIKLLSRPEDKRKPEEVTTDLLYRLVAESYRTSHEGDKKTPPVFVRLNGKDPSGTQMDRLRTLSQQFAPFSTISFDPDEKPGKARSGKLVEIEKLYISIKPSANGVGLDWSLSISPGPLSGRGSEGHCSLQHGYWIVKTTKHWVS